MERITLVFSLLYKLAENREFDSVSYGLKTVTEIITSDSNEKGFGLTQWVIPYYERLGVDCFKFEPSISSLVIAQFGQIIDHLTKKIPFVLANASSRITTASFNIASIIAEMPYSEHTLFSAYSLLQKIYVVKSIVDYGFSAYEELGIMTQLIEMMVKANFPSHLIAGFELQMNCEKLLRAEKYEMMQNLFVRTLNASPKDDSTLLHYANIIFHNVPLKKKEIIDALIKAIKVHFKHIDVQFKRTMDSSRTNIGVRNEVLEIESGNEDIDKNVEWFLEKK